MCHRVIFGSFDSSLHVISDSVPPGRHFNRKTLWFRASRVSLYPSNITQQFIKALTVAV